MWPQEPSSSAGEVSFGVRTGGGGGAGAAGGVLLERGDDVGLVSPGAEAAQLCLGVRSGRAGAGAGWGEGAAVAETVEYGEGGGGGGAQVAADGDGGEEEEPFMADEEEEVGWPEYPWWPVLADAIETSLRSMSLDELNDRMKVSYQT